MRCQKIQCKYEAKAGENEVIEEIADDDLPVPLMLLHRMYSYLAYNDDIYYRDAEVMRKVDTTDKNERYIQPTYQNYCHYA